MATPEIPAVREAAKESPAQEAAHADSSAAPEVLADDANKPEASAAAPVVEASEPAPEFPAEPPVNPVQGPVPAAPVVPEQPAPEPPKAAEAPAVAKAPEVLPGHIFTGKTVRVQLAIKDIGTFDHSFNVSSEPLIEIVNRFCKAKHEVDLNLLPGLKLKVNGNAVPTNQQAHLLGLEDDAVIEVSYD